MKKNAGIRTMLTMFCLAIFAILPMQAAFAAKMPGFALPSVTDDRIVNSDEYRNKFLLINFFATWCPPCREEMPYLQKMHDAYGARGFAVIAISVDDGGPRLVNKLAQKMKLTFPVVMADSKVSLDFGGIVGIPTSFLVNREGEIVKRYDGYFPHDILEEDLQKALTEGK